MEFTNTKVHGLDSAIKGMRNPLNSWDLSDSKICCDKICISCKEQFLHCCVDGFIVGDKDLDLAKRLIKSGTEHSKFLRQIQIWADVNMPRYWWGEMDTYHFNTKNSCSTMHKLLNKNKEITIDMFVYCEEDSEDLCKIISKLNELRKDFLKTHDDRLLIRAKRLLPEGFLQLRTVNTNYAETRVIYHQRKSHRLKEEWVDCYCKWAESLPYAKEFIM